ncbi:MAG: sulfatase-like hydrolase/transferase, partial [Acidobacteriota bacterium]
LEMVSLLAGSALAGAFLFFVIDGLARQFGVLPALKKRNLERFVVLVWPVLCLAIGWKFFRSPARSEFSARLNRVAVLLLPCLFFLSALHTPFSTDRSKPKHVVLLVLDAMPSNYLHSFNTEVPPVRLDQFLKEAVVFRNMRTRTPWTNGFFGTLYSGGPWFTFEAWASTFNRWQRAVLHPRWNLLTALQEKGVKTRWFVEHNAAIPESRQIYGYRGLRSFLLGDKFSTLLDTFRIDYNLLLNLPGTRSVVTPRRKPAYQLFNTESTPNNILLDYLVPQMEKFRKQASRTFLVFHVRWPMSIGHTLTPQDYEIDQTEDPDVNKIIGAGYRYTENEQWFAEKLAANYANNMAQGQKKLSDFLQECKKRNLMQDTLFIVTADHGEMAARGRLWYGYHPEEEILRVPMAIFFKGSAGVD